MPQFCVLFFFISLIYVCCLSQELSKRLGKLIQGEMDQYNRGVIFTPAFVARHRARIRGLFSGITRCFYYIVQRLHEHKEVLCKL